jgi:myo-inositol catabolism protein IolS
MLDNHDDRGRAKIAKRNCGNSSLKLSILGLGCWSFGGGDYWGDQDQKEVEAVVRRAVELGITYFDTAEAYNEGRSEESLGKAIGGLPREKLVIGSKISPANTYPETLVAHCHASLKRLATDYIDLYMVHWPIHPHAIRHFTTDERRIHNPPGVREAFETLLMLQQQGKIHYIGVSNFGIKRLAEIARYGINIVANELPYSLLTRAIEYEALPYCTDKGIGVIGYMALMQGLLTDKFTALTDLPLMRRRTRHFSAKKNRLCRHGEAGAEEETSQALAAIRLIAKEAGMPMHEIAIRWTLIKEGIICILAGARTIGQLEANVKAVSGTLPSEIMRKLDEATRPLMQKMGHSFDYFECTAKDRT